VAPRGAVALKKLAAVLLAASMLTCSWTTWFVVMNSSGESIRVTYTARPLETHPAVTANAKVEKSLTEWRELDVSGVRPDSDVLTIALGPDSAVLVAESRNGGPGAGEITSLKIITRGGERLYKGDAVPKAFVKRSRTLYVLEER
jgi:hypothetical protein